MTTERDEVYVQFVMPREEAEDLQAAADVDLYVYGVVRVAVREDLERQQDTPERTI